MYKTNIAIYTALIALLGLGPLALLQTVDATGGAGQIAEKVMGYLNDAQTYLSEGDINSAQEEIDTAINELKDTYEADQQENNKK